MQKGLVVLLVASIATFVNTPDAHALGTRGSGAAWQVLGSAGHMAAFFRPTAVTVDPQGRAFVLDSGNLRVVALTSNGHVIHAWGRRGTGRGEFGYGLELGPGGTHANGGPTGIAADGKGIVYVADTANNRIELFSRTGRFLTAWGSKGSATGQFLSPAALTVGGRGNLFVADLGNRRVVKLSPSGTVVGTWRVGEGGEPLALALDHSGNLFVAIHWQEDPVCDPSAFRCGCCPINHYTLEKRAPSGAIVAHWMLVPGSTRSEGQPGGLAVESNGSIVISDRDNNQLVVVSASGKVTALQGHTGAESGEFVDPTGVAVDGRGHIYIVDTGNNRIQILSSGLRPVARWGATGTGPGEFSLPTGVVVDSQRRIFIADGGDTRVQRLSPSGTAQVTWRFPGGSDQWSGPYAVSDPFYGRLSPVAMALGGRDNVFIADPLPALRQMAGAVLTYLPSGVRVQAWNGIIPRMCLPGAPCTLREIPVVPTGIAVGTGGAVYVMDGMNSQVVKLSPALAPRMTWRLNHLVPHALATDRHGAVYVAGFTGSPGSERITVTKFSASGKQMAGWTLDRGEAGGIALGRTGSIYLTDSLNSRVLKLSPNGRIVTHWGGSGSDTGHFHHPVGIAVDARGSVYVADTGNDRVQVLSNS